MIYLFDNCYLSTTNHIVENAKQVWIGSHPKLDDPMVESAYDILHFYEEIDDEQLDDLFNEIRQEHSDVKTVIYCDVPNFMYVYSFFFNGVLEKSAVDQLYKFDRLKENYRIGTGTGNLNGFEINRDITFINLPETLESVETASTFSSLLTETRIEIAFANSVRGNQDAKEFCVERGSQIFDGGSWIGNPEELLPTLLSRAEFTIENLTNEEFVNLKLAEFKIEEYFPNQTSKVLKNHFNFDYINHYCTVMNNSPEYETHKKEAEEFWGDLSNMDKESFIEKYMINPVFAQKYQLVFPGFSNFDSINPIFWNEIIKNKNNTAWLDKYKLKNGTYNQTN